jgi:hypothetical protein
MYRSPGATARRMSMRDGSGIAVAGYRLVMGF